MSMTNLLRVGVSALALTLMSGVAQAEDVPELDIVEEWVDSGEEIAIEDGGEIVYDDGCIDCNVIPDELPEEGLEFIDPVDDGTGEEPVEYLEDGEGTGEEPVEYVEDDGAVPDDGEVFPTSNCGGCEAWHEGGELPSLADPRPLSMVYRQALCADPAFAHVSACADVPLN
jgi:hypothetical protein